MGMVTSKHSLHSPQCKKFKAVGVTHLSFHQLIDDVLDFTSCSDQMGKPTSADLKLGLATGPVLFACQQVGFTVFETLLRSSMEPVSLDTAGKV